MSGFADEVKALVAARYPLVYLVSYEERRVEGILTDLSRELNKRLLIWTVTEGFVDAATRRAQENSSDPLQALDTVLKTPPPGANLYVLKDFHPFLKDVAAVRKLRDAVYHLTSTSSSLFILAPVLNLPPDLEKDTTILDVPKPDKGEFLALIEEFAQIYGNRATVTPDRRVREEIATALLGLTRTEAENVLSRALIGDRRLDAQDLPLIIGEKEQIIRKSGTLEFYSLREGFADVGGLDALKGWLERKRTVFAEQAAQRGVDPPRGVLLVGVPGCGKSLTAKAVANAWKMPLLRFDLGKVFGMYVGQSEENVRRAVATAESVAPCVLWIDEIEKGFSGAGQSDGDSGVTARVFGTFITWLNEKRKPVFVVATANDVRRLPPELLRKGRFDEIFFVDLPRAAERQEIFAVHLRSRGSDPARFPLADLAARCEGFSGSDIEGVVREAREVAYVNGDRSLTPEDLAAAIDATMPLAVTMKEQIAAMREWAQDRARPASTVREPVPVPTEAEFRQRRRLEL